MHKILNSRQMKSLDDYTINECGLMGEVLMERAALSVANAICKYEDKGSSILVACGNGNNGADGICTARILKDRGYRVTMCLVGDEKKSTPLYRVQKEIALKWGLGYYNNIPEDEYDVIVDALFGIGLKRPLEGQYYDVVAKINAFKGNAKNNNKRCRVYSVDIPSGICTDNGSVEGIAVEADITITFGYRKPGQMLNPGRKYCGKLIVEDIGFCPLDNAGISSEVFTYEDEDLNNVLPVRDSDANKGTYGKVLVVAGSHNMAGAAILCAKAAISAGAGLVKIFTCESNRLIIQTAVPEVILVTYSDGECEELIRREILWADVVVAGPGISTSKNSEMMVRCICGNITCPLLLDADALNIISENDDITMPENTIITPHLKEMSRLCGRTVSSIKENIMETAALFSTEKKVIVVLKDSNTVVSDGKKVYINSSGNDGLSTGGSGDVLAGFIASFMAQGLGNWKSAVSGVYVHGLAADIYASEYNAFSLTPTLLIEQLRKLQNNFRNGE